MTVSTIASVGLPVEESLRIYRSRFTPLDGQPDCGKRFCVVTGIHGDELEGQCVCYELARLFGEQPEHLHGTVDLYPAMNPFGIDSITRGLPAFDLDMNRIFPGSREGDMVEYIAAKIVEELEGSDLAVDIHASNIYLTEIPQIRINQLHEETLVPLAKQMNVDLIWIHGASTVLESTFAYSMNSRQVPTLVVEMGVGMRTTREYSRQLVTGILNTMASMGIWDGEVEPVREPVISAHPEDVIFLNSERSGIFIKEQTHGAHLKAGEVIGRVVNPLKGTILSEVTAPRDGWLFTIREYPVVEEGSLIARILKDDRPAYVPAATQKCGDREEA